MQPEFRLIPLAQLRVSATLSQVERREHLDKKAIDELAESIGTVGMLQPLVVRQRIFLPEDRTLPEDRRLYEIVAGERRFLAAKVAKLDTVPVTVRELTDEQVLEVQLVENLQRADVHPMAEAEGYEGLRKLGRTVDEIADKVGKSKGYVYARMKLLDLVKEGRTAFYAGKLNPSTALYLARVPMGLQLQALKTITETDYRGEHMSAREVQDVLQREYMLRLNDAPFDTKDAALVAKAGPCTTCPKRTGNNPGLFNDIDRADVCTDTLCFRQKVTAHLAVAVEKARAKGLEVIPAHQAKKLAPNGLHNIKGYVRLDGSQVWGGKYQTNKQILGKDYKAKTVIVDEKHGELVQVAPVSDLPKEKRQSSSSSSSTGSKAEKAKRDIEEKYRRELMLRVFKAAPETPSRDLLIMACNNAAYDCDHNDAMEVVRACGLPFKESANLYDEKAFLKLSDSELARLTLVLLLKAGSPSGGHGDAKALDTVAKSLQIDIKKVRADVVAAAKAAEPAPKAKSPARKK